MPAEKSQKEIEQAKAAKQAEQAEAAKKNVVPVAPVSDEKRKEAEMKRTDVPVATPEQRTPPGTTPMDPRTAQLQEGQGLEVASQKDNTPHDAPKSDEGHTYPPKSQASAPTESIVERVAGSQVFEVLDTVLIVRKVNDANVDEADTKKKGDKVTPEDFESPELFKRYLDAGAIAPVQL